MTLTSALPAAGRAVTDTHTLAELQRVLGVDLRI